MRRREFITLIGGAAAAWPLAARAQQPATPVVGFLNGSSATAYAAYVQAFISGLAETGLKVGENVSIEYRWAEGRYDRIPEMADDLVRRQVAVLAANTPAARAAKSAAGKIPLVFFTGEDPVAAGLVTSLNRPGGNATGVTTMFGGLAAKQVSLLRELVPTSKLIAFLVNPRNPITEPNVRDALEAARKLGQQIQIVNASSDTEIEVAFDTLREMRPGALLVQPDAFLINKRIVALADRCDPGHVSVPRSRRWGWAYELRTEPFGPVAPNGDICRQGSQWHQPRGLPVLQPTKFELAINMKTAKALGLRLSNNLLSLADELIE